MLRIEKLDATAVANAGEVPKQLSMEFAVKAQKLLGISFEESVG